jgi:hypothetical protein
MCVKCTAGSQPITTLQAHKTSLALVGAPCTLHAVGVASTTDAAVMRHLLDSCLHVNTCLVPSLSLILQASEQLPSSNPTQTYVKRCFTIRTSHWATSALPGR